MAENNETQKKEKKIGVVGYLALLAAIVFFSGTLVYVNQWWAFLDFSKIYGKYGAVAGKVNYMGIGGDGMRHGFLFAVSLIPGLMLSLGFIEVIDYLGGLRAGEKLFRPLLKPTMGIPSVTSLTLITSLQSSDAAGAMLKELYDRKEMTINELVVTCAWGFASPGTISNCFGAMIGFHEYIVVPLWVILLVMFFFKGVAANLARVYLKFMVKSE